MWWWWVALCGWNLLAGQKPLPRESLAGTEGERALPDPICVTSICTSWFHGHFQKSSPNASRCWMCSTTGWTEGILMGIFAWESLYLFLWSTKSLDFGALFMWCGTAVQGWIWISSSAPPWTCSGEQNQNFLLFPWGIHNSLLSCCLGLTHLHIPKCVKGRSGSRKEHGKS